jgi:hypothetical protein
VPGALKKPKPEPVVVEKKTFGVKSRNPKLKKVKSTHEKVVMHDWLNLRENKEDVACKL